MASDDEATYNWLMIIHRRDTVLLLARELYAENILMECLCVCVCLCLCFFVPYARPQFWADLHEIWHVASLFPPDGRGRGLASAAWTRGLALHALSIHRCKSVAGCGHLTSGHKTSSICVTA